MGGGGPCRSRLLWARSLPFLRHRRPRVSAGDYGGNRTNRPRNRRHAARSPPSGVIRPRRSHPAVRAGTATSRRGTCRLWLTFRGVMRWRLKDPPELAMRCRFAPLKKIKETEAIFAQVEQVHERAAGSEDSLRISSDTKAKVQVGKFSRDGAARGEEAVKALDHDMEPEATLGPFGILEVVRGLLTILFGTTRLTSDWPDA